MVNKLPTTGKVALPPPTGSARPQTGEVWIHGEHGAVTIIKAWGSKESVVEIHARRSMPVIRRRAVLKNETLRKP